MKQTTATTTLNPPAADWRAFAAAGAAGLAAVAHADASIIYTNPINPFTVSLPATADQGTQSFHARLNLSNLPCQVTMSLIHQLGNHDSGILHVTNGGLALTTNGFGRRYAPGSAIGTPAGTGSEAILGRRLRGQPAQGNFAIGQSGLAALQTSGGRRAWIRVELLDPNNDGYPEEMEAIKWAYNDVPGGPLAAGQTMAAAPEPGTTALLLLAAGSAGVLAWRKRRNAAAAA